MQWSSNKQLQMHVWLDELARDQRETRQRHRPHRQAEQLARTKARFAVQITTIKHDKWAIMIENL